MPKEIRTSRISSINRSRAYPYPSSSKNTEEKKLEQSVLSLGNEKEWEEVRCPICMDHPHNAVLLMCSAHGKGCRAYMCDSSRRHSNCLDQFRKTSPACKLFDISDEERPLEMGGNSATLHCPLCRGKVRGFIVVKPARDFMNSKSRSCSLETCGFSGTYSELRKHARLEHPTVQPSNADPRRQNEWAMLEREIDYQDFISATQGSHGEDAEWNVGSLMDLEMNFEEMLNSFDILDSEYGFDWDNNPYLDMEIEMPFTFLDVPVAPTVWIEANDYRHVSVGQEMLHSSSRRSSRQSRPVPEIQTQTRPRTNGSQSTRESHQSYSSRETWQNQRGSMPHYSGGRDDGATSRPTPLPSPDTWFSHRPRSQRERRGS